MYLIGFVLKFLSHEGVKMATTGRGLRYPLAADTPAVHTDIKNLADDSDAEFDDFQIMEIMKAN